jgi:ABC-type polysaccharide/polyol phosphate export permease
MSQSTNQIPDKDDTSQDVDGFESAEPSSVALAIEDIREGLARRWQWGELALRDIKSRYYGSILGPFWVTLSTAVLIAVIGFIYERLLKVNAAQYLPYISVGVVIWMSIAAVLTSAGATFVSASGIIQQVRLPLTVHVLREAMRQVIVFFHMLVLVPIVLLIFGHPITWTAVYAIPGLIFLFINVISVSMVLGIVSARFRDIPQIVASTIQILFFCTPVFWYPDTMGEFGQWMTLNPIYAVIDVIRAPILGEAIQPFSWPIVVGVTLLGLLMAFRLFAKFRSRIVFWV